MGTCDIAAWSDGYRSIDWHPPFGPFITLSPEAWAALLESIQSYQHEWTEDNRGPRHRR